MKALTPRQKRLRKSITQMTKAELIRLAYRNNRAIMRRSSGT
jgi:hypothetical protein